ASTSSTRPVTGALMRTSCSSLNCTLAVVSSSAVRVRYSGRTMVTGLTAALGAADFPGGEDLASPQPAARAVVRRSARTRILLLQRAADGGLELVDGGVIIAERAEVLQRLLPIVPLGIEVVQQRHATALVGEFNSVARLLDLGQVGVPEQGDLGPLRGEGREGQVDFGERLGEECLTRRFGALGLGLRPGDLALVPVEELDGQAEAE